MSVRAPVADSEAVRSLDPCAGALGRFPCGDQRQQCCPEREGGRDEASADLWAAGGWDGPSELSQAEAKRSGVWAAAATSPGMLAAGTERLNLPDSSEAARGAEGRSTPGGLGVTPQPRVSASVLPGRGCRTTSLAPPSPHIQMCRCPER